MVGAEAKKQQRQTPPAVSAEQYREACAVLRPDTMRDACRLLLGSLAGDTNEHDGGDAGDKLLDLYRRVKSAADVIEKRGQQQRQQSGAGGTGSCLNSPVGGVGSVSAAGGGAGPPPLQLPRARPSMMSAVVSTTGVSVISAMAAKTNCLQCENNSVKRFKPR